MATAVETYERQELPQERLAEYPDIPLEVRSWLEVHNWQVYIYHQPTGTRLIFAAAGNGRQFPLEIHVGNFVGIALADFRYCEVYVQNPLDKGQREFLQHAYSNLLRGAAIHNLGSINLADYDTPKGNERWVRFTGQPEENHWGAVTRSELMIDSTGTQMFRGGLHVSPTLPEPIPILGMG